MPKSKTISNSKLLSLGYQELRKEIELLKQAISVLTQFSHYHATDEEMAEKQEQLANKSENSD